MRAPAMDAGALLRVCMEKEGGREGGRGEGRERGREGGRERGRENERVKKKRQMRAASVCVRMPLQI